MDKVIATLLVLMAFLQITVVVIMTIEHINEKDKH